MGRNLFVRRSCAVVAPFVAVVAAWSERPYLMVSHLSHAAYFYDKEGKEAQAYLDRELGFCRWARVKETFPKEKAILVAVNVWGWRRDILCFAGTDGAGDMLLSWPSLAFAGACPVRDFGNVKPYAVVGHSLGGQAAEVFGLKHGIYWFNVNGPSVQHLGAGLLRYFDNEFQKRRRAHGR
jgi:hypothetical protein